MSVVKDISGQRFGSLLVIERTKTTDKKQRAFWKCKCLCGKTIDVRGDRLRLGTSTKCSFCRNGMGRASREIV